MVLKTCGKNIRSAVRQGVGNQNHRAVINLPDLVTRFFRLQRKAHRIGGAGLDRFGNRIRPAQVVHMLGRAEAKLEVQRRVNEFKRLRFYAARGEQLQQPFAEANRAAGIAAHIDNQSVLRKAVSGDDAANFVDELIDYLALVRDLKSVKAYVAVIAAGDGSRLGSKIIFEGLNPDRMRVRKEILPELVDFSFLNIQRGALLFVWFCAFGGAVRFVDPPLKAQRKFFAGLRFIG